MKLSALKLAPVHHVAFPVNQDASSREGFWSIQDESTNLAIDKKYPPKNFE